MNYENLSIPELKESLKISSKKLIGVYADIKNHYQN